MQIKKQLKRMGKSSSAEWDKFYREHPEAARRQIQEREKYLWVMR